MRPDDPRDDAVDPELEEIASLLEQAGREQRLDLARAARPVPDEERAVERALATLWRPSGGRMRARRLALALAAAAALVALLVLEPWRGSGEGGQGGGELLGEHELRLVHPRGAVDSYAPIAWTGSEGPLRLSVHAADGMRLLGPVRVEGSSFTPPADELARWPAEIRVELERTLPDGGLERAVATARRVP